MDIDGDPKKFTDIYGIDAHQLIPVDINGYSQVSMNTHGFQLDIHGHALIEWVSIQTVVTLYKFGVKWGLINLG